MPWQQTALDLWPDPPPQRPKAAPPPAPSQQPPAPSRQPLRIGILGSGSAGNAVVIESGSCRILIDAGFSCREIVRRLALLGIAPDGFSALVLTHEHGDHCRGAERFARRFRLPVLATAGTFAEAPLSSQVAERCVVLQSGEKVQIGGFEIEPFLIPHDAREPIGMVVEDGCGRRVGLAADLGSRSQLAWGRLAALDALLLETNHDLDMLRNGPYPWSLKQRVAGRHGHLSNADAATGLPELLSDRLRWVALYHLSRTNNLPALAAAAIGEVLEREGSRARMAVTEQDHPTPWLEI